MKKSKDFTLTLGGTRTVVLCFAIACGNATTPAPTPSSSSRPSSNASFKTDHDHHEKGHQHRFDDAAKWSKVFDDPARDAWQKPAHVVELMAISPGMTVADVGAGTGYFEPHLSRAVGPNGKVIAEDVEPDMVKWLGDRFSGSKKVTSEKDIANVTALQGAADDPKLPTGAVDRILIVDTWHHVDDRSAFAKKLASSVKREGGAVFIVDFTMESPHGPPKHARLTPEAIIGELERGGFRASVMKEASLPNQYVVRGVLAP